MQALVRRVALGDRVRAWIARLVEATRPDAPNPPPLLPNIQPLASFE